jgi:Cu(I)/Ag(I) efflux system membrane protein CusA/SilA
VRGFSTSAILFVYVIYDDGTDIYWRARAGIFTRAAVAAAGVQTGNRPGRHRPPLIYQYALVDTSGKRNFADLRSYQTGI